MHRQVGGLKIMWKLCFTLLLTNCNRYYLQYWFSYYHLIYVQYVMSFPHCSRVQGEVRRHGISYFILGCIWNCSAVAVLNIFCFIVK